MFNVKGKNGEAKIFTDLTDEATIGQIISILNSDLAIDSQVRIMPDCHAGAGCVIGTTMTGTDKICPNIVGVDIGCGMLVIELGKVEIDFEKFDRCCHEIPSGNAVYEDVRKIDHQWNQSNFVKNRYDWLDSFECAKLLKNKERLWGSLGTLGGGNHFIELDKDDENNIYLVIHSGSRNLGKQVAEIYQGVAERKLSDNTTEKQVLIAKLKAEGRFNEIQDKLIELSKKQPKTPKELAYLTDVDKSNYYYDMHLCQRFASENRKRIAFQLLEKYFERKIKKQEFSYFETIHNYMDFENWILRKGAVSAQDGEKLIIPMNMRDGSLICIGKGNPDWNYSAPHGAGRLMSRAEARKKISLEEFSNSMQGIYSTTVVRSTIDESPMAYKPMDTIVENIQDTVDIIKIIKPIYNFKASDEEPIWKNDSKSKKGA